MSLPILMFALQGCTLLALSATSFADNSCFTRRTPSIPNCHIYHSKRTPLVIAHRGNPKRYQENSLAGFKSLVRSRADGFEVDVFLTKDRRLVCFHDENALRLTAVNRKIADITSAEIRRMRYQKSIKYGKKVFRFRRRRPIAFLDEVLRWAKRTNMLVYIEMKPSNPVLTSKAAIQSTQTGLAVAKIVRSFCMVNQVFLNGYDILKTYTAKKTVSDLVIGTAYIKNFWYVPFPVLASVKNQLQRLIPSLAPCLGPIAATSNRFTNYLYLSGVVEKAIHAAYTDVDLAMYDNPAFGTTNTVGSFRANYSSNYVLGAYTAYSMERNASAHKASEAKIAMLIQQGVNFFITDDVAKMAKTIRRYGHKCPKKHMIRGDEGDWDSKANVDKEDNAIEEIRIDE